MDDDKRAEWSRHYDNIQWTVITIFTAGVGALAGVSLSQGVPSSCWPDAAGLGLIVLGLFYVASFRSIRQTLHGQIEDPILKAFLKKPWGSSRLPHQWDMFALSFLLISFIFDYQLARKSGGCFWLVLGLSGACVSTILALLWLSARPEAEPGTTHSEGSGAAQQ